MLNRRVLRVKVMQALYGFFHDDDSDLNAVEKTLFLSINRVYELYLHFLVLPIELADIAEIQMEEARNKVLPTQEDLNPNRRFVDSYVIQALRENGLLMSAIERHKVSWANDRDEIKKLWREIKNSELYSEYLKSEENAVEDRKFIERITKRFFLDNDSLYQLFQERSIYWDFEDCDYTINMALRYFGKIKAVDRYKTLPQMWKDEEEDKTFVKQLFRRVISNDESNTKVIDSKTKNWDSDRIAHLDILLMKMAITELVEFRSIPVKVTLNEYIELSKFFSTPKSKIFINGVLDKVVSEFNREKKIKKTGRGLIQ